MHRVRDPRQLWRWPSSRSPVLQIQPPQGSLTSSNWVWSSSTSSSCSLSFSSSFWGVRAPVGFQSAHQCSERGAASGAAGEGIAKAARRRRHSGRGRPCERPVAKQHLSQVKLALQRFVELVPVGLHLRRKGGSSGAHRKRFPLPRRGNTAPEVAGCLTWPIASWSFSWTAARA